MITGNYTEDFEDVTVTESLDNHSAGDRSEDDDTIRESLNNKPSKSKPSTKTPIKPSNKPSTKQSSNSKPASNKVRRQSQVADNSPTLSDDDNDETISDQVLLSIKDVSKLRKSLELSKLVRESICQDTDESDLEEEIDDIMASTDMLSAGDTIVLEFAPLKSNKTPIPTSHRSVSSQSHTQSRNDRVRKSKSDRKGQVRNGHGNSIELKPSASKNSSTPRPLSSVKRASVDSTTESVEQKSAVLSALAKENEKVSEYRKKAQKNLSESRVGNPLMNSFMVNDEDDMKGIEDRVLQMEPKQQRDLIKTLYKLERTVRPSSTAGASRKAKHNRTRSKDTEVHKVLLELLSNWGHNQKIGLTEIMLLDECNSKIEVNTSFLRLEGAKNCIGHESNLFNHKVRTVKERNMFCCERSGQRPVSLSFRVEIPLGSQINKVKFWNYNKSLTELSIGVRRIRISIDDDIIFDGDIDKGCGNQVFDYGYTVAIGGDSDSDAPPRNIDTPNHDERSVGPAKGNATPRSSRDTNSKRDQSSERLRDSKNSKPYSKDLRNSNDNATQNSHLRTSNEQASSQRGAERKPPQHKSPSKRLHHPEHQSLRKSGAARQSAEMWIPLSDTPEPQDLERCQTRILHHSTDGVQVPVVDSDQEVEQDKETYNDITDKQAPKGIYFNNNLSDASPLVEPSRQSISKKPPRPGSKKSLESKTKNTSKPPINTTQAKLPWMENFDATKSISQRSQSPVQTTSSPTQESAAPDGRNSRSSVLAQWVEKNKSDPLRSSLDDMLEALDMWDPGNEKKNKGDDLKTIFDDPAPEPTQSDGIPTKVASEKEEANYRRTASREMSRTEQSVTDVKQSPRASRRREAAAAARRKKWQQPSVDLEASWTSLDAFAKSHKGRLSMEGDALDEYLRGVGTPGTGVTVDGSNTQPPDVSTTGNLNSLEAINEAESFIIPELPCGRNLSVNIKSTWGDKYYVGLNGIELFADTGEPISISKITANPRDINILPDYQNDPRVVSNLVDGINKTRDDIHMWLAPFTETGNHFICLTFTQPSRVALMRIWNYNKSRIHSYRGAKLIEISLDGHYIFKGEIARACGGTQGGTEAFGDTILFTTSEEILDAVSRHDGQYEGGNFSDEWEDDVPYDARPATADKGDSDRPHTSVAGKIEQRKGSVQQSIATPAKSDTDQISHEQQTSGDMTAQPVAVDGSTLVYQAKRVTLNFTETWGDAHYLGLTGLELVSKDGEAIPITLDMMHAEPRDLHILPGYETDDRTLDKVIDGENITISDEHMWLIPYTEGANHTLTVTFSQPQQIVGLRFWNYNKSAEDTYRGAKTVHVLLDGCPVSPPQGFLIRKGPGSCHYDFAQELLFSDILRQIHLDGQISAKISDETGSTDEADDYIISGNMPKGFVYQFHLLSTHSDLYYLGLNAIEFYDAEGKKIQLDENNLAAYPESVNVLDGISGDVRTPDKLINGENDTSNGDHMWLAPILPAITNRLFVIFDYPQTVSMIKLWNYSKTASRGVKDFALLVDDLVVYNGTLGIAQFGKGILPGAPGPQNFHTILFTNNPKIKNKVKHTVVCNRAEELDIQLTNDNLVVSKPLNKLQKSADQALRPKTSLQKRPLGRRR